MFGNSSLNALNEQARLQRVQYLRNWGWECVMGIGEEEASEGFEERGYEVRSGFTDTHPGLV